MKPDRLPGPADPGVYRMAGRDVGKLSRESARARPGEQIGFVFRASTCCPGPARWRNVELPLLYQGVSSRERHRRASEALERVGLSDRLDHTPAQLSGGQQAAVAIARALVNRPTLLAADEPTGNLDSRTSVEVMAIFQELNEQGSHGAAGHP